MDSINLCLFLQVKLRRNVAGGGAFNELQVAQYARSLENAKSALAAVEAENARLKKEVHFDTHC